MVTHRPDDDFPFADETSARDPGQPDGEELERDRESDRDRDARRRRKERVLHTRISEQLSEDIRRAADDLRVPVSNLVRNVLEEAFGAVERVSDEVGAFLEEVLSDAEGARSDLRRLGRRFQALARRQRRRFAGAAREFDGRGGRDRAGDARDAGARAARSERGARETGRRPRSRRRRAALRPSPTCSAGSRSSRTRRARAPRASGRSRRASARSSGATERGLSRTFLCAACMRARGGA